MGEIKQVLNLVPRTGKFKNPQRGRVFSPHGIAPALDCMGGGGREVKVMIVGKMSSSQNARVIDPEGISYAVTNGQKDGAPKIIQRPRGFNKGGLHDTAPAVTGKSYKDNNVVAMPSEIGGRIRKCTPRECFRLMGVDDANIDKIQAAGVSNTQQYKMAGNSIVVDVLYHIFKNMFAETEQKTGQLSLF